MAWGGISSTASDECGLKAECSTGSDVEWVSAGGGGARNTVLGGESGMPSVDARSPSNVEAKPLASVDIVD